MGKRIEVTGGPWAKRHGCRGWIVTDEMPHGVYPRDGLGEDEIVVRLDEDPLRRQWVQTQWSCVLNRRDVKVIEEVDA